MRMRGHHSWAKAPCRIHGTAGEGVAGFGGRETFGREERGGRGWCGGRRGTERDKTFNDIHYKPPSKTGSGFNYSNMLAFL